jgi:hypothetical protein
MPRRGLRRNGVDAHLRYSSCDFKWIAPAPANLRVGNGFKIKGPQDLVVAQGPVTYSGAGLTFILAKCFEVGMCPRLSIKRDGFGAPRIRSKFDNHRVTEISF